MRRSILLVMAMVAISSWSFAQMGRLSAAQQAPPPQVTAPAQPMVGTSGAVIITGGYATTVPFSAPLVSTPIITLGVTSPNPVGATNGTSNNQVGASNSTLNNVTAPEPAVLPQVQIINPNYSATTTEVPAAATAEAAGPAPNASLIVGPAPSGDGMAAARSLGEVAAWYREHPQRAARVYTNDDIARLNQPAGSSPSQGGSTSTGNSGGTTGAVVSSAPGNPAPNQGGVLPPSVAAPAQPSAPAPATNIPPGKRNPYAPPR